MLFLFIKERMAWIGFIISLVFISNVLFYFDSGFANVPVVYYNMVISLLLVVFFIWRYFYETRQLKNLLEYSLDEFFDVNKVNLSPFQRAYLERMKIILEEKNYQLNQSKIQLQEELEDILAWVHEMKTPLTAMRLMTEQIHDYSLRNKVEKEWLRLHLLLDQQLYKTRIRDIEKDNRLETVQIKSVVFNEIKEYQSWCLEKGIGFEIENVNVEIITDKKWLSFILRQLLSNAIKYSNENDEIKIYTERDESGHLLLHVQDFGIGISCEDLPRIFEKSFTGTIGRNKGHSTGMGLYLAKNAANKLGIQLYVQSSLGNGSTFTLQFPLENTYESTFGR